MHQDQAMRSMQLSQQPHTPNMSALDVASPLQQAQALGASPRNPTTARQMQRELSKGGAMLPPQSPANTAQRTSTPKPGTSGKTPGATSKIPKEESMVDRFPTCGSPLTWDFSGRIQPRRALSLLRSTASSRWPVIHTRPLPVMVSPLLLLLRTRRKPSKRPIPFHHYQQVRTPSASQRVQI